MSSTARPKKQASRGVIAHEVADEPRGREDLVEAEDVLLERMCGLHENQREELVLIARLHDASASRSQHSTVAAARIGLR